MIKTRQNILDQNTDLRRNYSDIIIQQTLKRRTKNSRKRTLCSIKVSNYTHISDLICDTNYPSSFNSFRARKTKRLLLWSDLVSTKKILSNKRTYPKIQDIPMPQNNFVIIWLYTNNTDNDKEYIKDILTTDRQVRFDTLINDIKIFNNFKKCFNYLSTLSTKKIFFIISGSSSKTLVPLIYEHEQIQFIYIYSIYRYKHTEWIKNYNKKIPGIFNNKNNLIDKLMEDLVEISSLQNTFPSISIFSLSEKEKSVKDLNKEQAKFLWFQLLLEILLHLPSRKTSKNDMINECKLKYSNNEYELKKIDEFEKTYHSTNAIEWYTRDSFLYRLLNQAFRLQDIDIIFKFRFIIKDIYNELNKLYPNFISTNQKILYVYRGQGIFRDEFDNLKQNIGGFISINSFFSTTISSALALQFAGDGSERPFIESVLFEIEIDTTTIAKPFANIEKVSYLKTENEVLFSMGNIFQIKSIEDLTENIWIIKLILSTENEQLNQLIQHFKNDIGKDTDIFTFAIFLYKMGDFIRTEKYFNIVIHQLYLSPLDKARIFNCTGALYDEKGDYDKALKFYKKALKLQLKFQIIFQDPGHLAITYNNLGHLFDNKGQYNLALKYYKKSLVIDRILFTINKNQLSIAYGNIGCVQIKQNKFEMGLKNLKKALNIRLKYLPSNHPDIAITYNNIGQIYFQIGNYTNALENYKKALNNQQMFLIPNHPSLATTFSNTGELYSELGMYDDALEYYTKAIDIQQKILPLNHPDLAVMFDNIGCVYSKQNDYHKALEYFQKALTIELISLTKNHPTLATTYNNIGNTYYQQKDYLLALQYLRKALQIRSAIFPIKDLSFASVYNNMALIYYQKLNYIQALKYHKKALHIKLLHLPAYHPDLGSSYNNIGLIYHRKKDYIKALENYKKCVQIRVQTLPSNHPDIGITYDNIGMVYYDKQDYENALIYLKKALDIQLPLNQTYIYVTYLNLTQVYLKLEDRDMASMYYNKYLETQNK